VIVCVRIEGQVLEGRDDIAFVDTVSDTFVEINGSQFWDDPDDLRADLRLDASTADDIGRFTSLVPETWPRKCSYCGRSGDVHDYEGPGYFHPSCVVLAIDELNQR